MAALGPCVVCVRARVYACVSACVHESECLFVCVSLGCVVCSPVFGVMDIFCFRRALHWHCGQPVGCEFASPSAVPFGFYMLGIIDRLLLPAGSPLLVVMTHERGVSL